MSGVAELDLGWIQEVFSASASAEPEVTAESIRIARRLRLSGKQAIGLWPAGVDVAALPLAFRLGMALVRVSGASVALVDANVRYPALPVTGTRGSVSGSELIFAERWVSSSVVLLSPQFIGDAAAGVYQLEVILARYRDRFGHLLVDLSGFERLGDHLNAATLLDGVVIVGRARRTRERDLLRLRHQLPHDLDLGVVLIG